MANYRNVQIEKVSTLFIGHIHYIKIELDFGSGVISINPKKSWFVDDGVDKLGNKKTYEPFYKLFQIFDIDCEDGADINNLKGKYCRIVYDDNYRIIGLCHILYDDVWVDIDDLS